MNRYANLHHIQQLDPQKDHLEIVYLVGAYEFPFETQRALEFALFRTFAIPSISGVLDRSGEFLRCGQQRYDDTSLIIAEIAEHGYDSEHGRAAIRQMNQIHAHFKISNDDYLYVLSTFIFEPIRWNKLLGWRPSTAQEKLAVYYFWCEVGRRMNIQNIPNSYEEFEQYNLSYERDKFRFAESNHSVAESSIQVFLAWFPTLIRPLGRQIIYALLDLPLANALGYKRPPIWFIRLIHKLVRLRAILIKWLPPRKTPYLYTQIKNRTYPDGYKITNLGPEFEHRKK